jgi:hypothetical protein
MLKFNKYQKRFEKLIIGAILLLITVVVFSCNPQDANRSKKDQKNGKRDLSYPAELQVGKLVPVQNPIDHALSLVDLKRADLRRPLFHEEGYNLIARNPLIDRVAQSPFYLHHWADTNSKELQKNAQNGIQPVVTYLIETLNGGVAYDARLEASDSVFSLAESYAYLCRQYSVAPRQTIFEDIQKAGFAADFDRQLGALMIRIIHAATGWNSIQFFDGSHTHPD